MKLGLEMKSIEAEIITLSSCVKKIKCSKKQKVVVSGPQRSGTHVAARILSDLLGFQYKEEKSFGINDYQRFLKEFQDLSKICVQAPGLTHKLHSLPKEWFVVYMCRSFEDIFKSQKRIDWNAEGVEKAKYKKQFNLQQLLLKHPIAKVKWLLFCLEQYPKIESRAAALDYESLSQHPKWVPMSERPKKLYKKSIPKQ